MRHASGRYIAFLDSDDTVPQDAYQHMVETADRHGSDMVVGILQSFSETRSWVAVPIHRNEFHREVGRTSLAEMPSLVWDISACNRIIRHSVIQENNLRFPEHSSGEDLSFTIRAYLACSAITILPEIVYNYRGRENSRTGQLSPEFFRNRVHVTQSLKRYFAGRKLEQAYETLILSEARKLCTHRLRRVLKTADHHEIMEILQEINSLVGHLSPIDLSRLSYFSTAEQIRLLLISEKEYPALIALESAPGSQRFWNLIKSENVKAQLPPLVDEYANVPKEKKRDFLSKLKRKTGKRFAFLGKFRKKYSLPILKFMLVYPIARIAAFLRGRGTWLIDERLSTSAEDNGYFLFRYLRENRPELPAYYILDRTSRHWSKIASLGKVIPQYSFRHAFLLGQADVFASTDTFYSLAFPHKTFPALLEKTCNVFLQHGVAGNKTISYTRDRYPYFSKIIVSNEIERRFFQDDHYGFDEDQVALTGLARFDDLPTRRTETLARKVLVAPTWRNWLTNHGQVESSRYFHIWNRFLTNPDLAQVLERHDTQLVFRPHFRMMPFISAFETETQHIQIVQDLDELLHGLIREADLLVTDYSSVMYDFFYQEKPVLAFMFDRLEWETQPPGPPHMDFDRDLAAEVIEDSPSLLACLERYIENGCEMRPEHKERLPKLFTYRDDRNCERICAEIVKDLQERR